MEQPDTPIHLPDGTVKRLADCSPAEVEAAERYAKRWLRRLAAYIAKQDELTEQVFVTRRPPTQAQQLELARLELELADDPHFLAIHQMHEPE